MSASRARLPALGFLVLAAAVLPAALSDKARSPHQGGACSSGDSATCAAEAAAGRATTVQAETYLVQYQAELRQRASASPIAAPGDVDGTVVAEGIRQTFTDLLKVGNAIRAAFDAIRSAVPFFGDGKIAAGLAAFADGLLEAVIYILPSDVTGSSRFADFRQNWAQVTETIPGIVEGARAGIDLYKEEGDVSGLLKVCLDVVQSYAPFVLQLIPGEASVEVAKFLGAVEDAIEEYSEAVEIYVAGNISDAVTHIYAGVRMVISELVPEEWQSNEKILAAVAVLDTAIGNLTSIVLRLHARSVEAGACWKAHSPRERARPDRCPESHVYDGLHWCFPQGTVPPVQIKNANGICMRSRRGLGGLGYDQVEMAVCDRSDLKQQWFLDGQGGHLRSSGGKCLYVSERDAVGGDVLLRTCKDGKIGQDWEYSESDGSIRVKGGLCLDAAKYDDKAGRLQIYTCDAAKESQQWAVSSNDEQESSPALLDASAGRKKKAIFVMASCDETGAFTDQVGPWCYKGCPVGSEAAGGRCRTTCQGEYPASAPLMCGKSYKSLAAAFQVIAAGTFTMGKTTKAMKSSLGLAGGLSQTIDAMIELGIGAAHPKCDW